MTRDADRYLEPDVDPDRACARDWQPIEAPERRPEPKYKDEPVQRSLAVTDASDPDPDREPQPGPEPDVDSNQERPRTRAAGPTAGATPRADPVVRVHDTRERDDSERPDCGDGEPDGGGRHG